MSTKNSQEPVKEAKSASDEQIMALILSMADTTWRMFTPPALLVGGGIWADLKFGTKPWLTVLGAVVGLALSVLLVRKLLGRSS